MERIQTIKLFDAEAISKNGNTLSAQFDRREVSERNLFSVHYIFTGSGQLKFEYLLCSTPDGTYLEPGGASDIAQGLSAGSDIITFAPVLAPFLKIKATEENVNSITSLTLWINYQ
jgi:hypothetical protein